MRCTLVVTQPDRPAGRGHRLAPTPVKLAANELGIPTLEPTRVGDAVERLREEAPDLFAVASYGKIVPQRVLDIPRSIALNVHPSLLPRYRGATPLQSQIRDGVVESGVTIIAMDAGMDTGDVVLVERSDIGARETYGELHDRFAELGAALLGRACDAFAKGALERRPQRDFGTEEEATSTRTRPFSKDDLSIARWCRGRNATDIVNAIRSLAPAPGARGRMGVARDADGDAAVDGELRATIAATKILEAHVLDVPGPRADVPFGEVVVAEGRLLLRADDGWVVADRIVLPGGKPMTAADLRNGRKSLTGPAHVAPALHAWAQGYPAVAR